MKHKKATTMELIKGNKKDDNQALKVLSFGDLLDTQLPTREHIISPWLRQGESVLLYGGPGVGKSMLTLSLALLVAGGGEFLDWTNDTPRKVLLIDGEMALDDLRDRGGALVGGVDGLDMGAVRDNLTILSRQCQNPDATFPDISTVEGREQILKYSREGLGSNDGPFDLVVLDNLSTLALEIEDENAASEFNDVVRLLMRLKQASVATLLVHHTNKSGKEYRGSSKLATTFEVILGMKLIENPPTDWPGTTFTLEWRKCRGIRDETMTDKDVRFYRDKNETVCWDCRLSSNEEVTKLVRLVETEAYRTQDELAKAMGVSTGKLSKLKHTAFHTGVISEEEWSEHLNNCEF